jgi:hypothetical protein
VLRESNRIHSLFLERNPGFKGTVHVIGHSLGSAIMFDLLCRQQEKKTAAENAEPYHNRLSILPSTNAKKSRSATIFDEDELDGATPLESKTNLEFNFDVQDFYCLGSPIGLFQMLKGRTIAARHLLKSPQTPEQVSSLSSSAMVSSLADSDGSPYGFESTDDTFLTAPSTTATDQRISSITGLPLSISSPKVGQLFNIFHPSDPISYRLEPLISPAMKNLKPQPLPYTKKGLFGSVAPQGLTDIGAKVGQSVSGLWSSFQAGIATNIMNRSFGVTPDGVSKLNQQEQKQGAAGEGGNGANDFVVDEEVETLFSHFEKKRADMAKESAKDGKSEDNGDDESREARAARRRREDAKVQRMRREEAKVRALNRNGRVDFHIQEGVMDFNPINTVASHMAYWGDPDVSHFIMTQVFTGKLWASAKTKKAISSGT